MGKGFGGSTEISVPKFEIITSGILKNGISFVSSPYRSALNNTGAKTGSLIFSGATGTYYRAYQTLTSSSGQYSVCMHTSNKIDITKYSVLYVDWEYQYYHSNPSDGTTNTCTGFFVTPSAITANDFPVSTYDIIVATNSSVTSKTTVSRSSILNLEDLQGEHYIGADLTFRPGSSNGLTDLRIYNMWLA